MPLKVDGIKNADISVKRTVPMFKTKTSKFEFVNYRGNNVMRGSSFNAFHSVVFKSLDKLEPLMKKFPKFSDKVISLCAKLLKNANDFK